MGIFDVFNLFICKYFLSLNLFISEKKLIDLKTIDSKPILEPEPDLGKGVAGALRLAMSKGYIEKEENARPSASRFAHLQAKNYSIEDKTHL